MSTTTRSSMTVGETVDIDGYKFNYEKPSPISWTPFRSNSWRTRLKRVHRSSTGNLSAGVDKSSSSEGIPLRYTYAYPCRYRGSTSEMLPSIESCILLEIAGSSAQAFKDVEETLKKHGNAKGFSKKSRKTVIPNEQKTTSSIRCLTKKRGREPEERSHSKEESGRVAEKSVAVMKKRKAKDSEKTKPAKEVSREPEEVNEEKSSVNTFPCHPISSPERTSRQSACDGQELRKEKSSSVNIENWSEHQIISHFGLKEFTIDVSGFPHHELQPSTSSSISDGGTMRKVKNEELVNVEKEFHLGKNNEDVVGFEHKKKKRKRSISSSSSLSCTSSDEGGSSRSDCGNEPSAQSKNTCRKKAHSERPCVECGRWLDQCVMDWKETLGTSTVWCSRECIERRVARAHEVLPEGYGALTLLRGDGQLLTTGPTLANLAEFIFKYPEYEPILPVAKKKQVAKNDRGSDPKKAASRTLAKDADRIRFNVRRAFSDALLKRAKMDKVKSAMKLCKDVSESIEAALFKYCDSNMNSTFYKTWTKSFIENVADCRNKSFYYRVLTGMISVHKVVTLDSSEMRKPEYSSALDEVPSAVNNVAELCNAASPSTVADKTDQSVSTCAMKKEALSTVVSKSASTVTKKTEVKQAELITRRSVVQKTKSAVSSLSALDSILGDGAKDTTEQHLSHFYDVNCSICLAKQKAQAEAERKEKEEKERQREEDRRFREMLPPIRQPEYSRSKSASFVDLDYSVNSGRGSGDELARMRTPESTGAACASDDDYAGSYGDVEECSPLFRDGRDIQIQRNLSYDRNISTNELMWNCARTVWTGQISLNNASMRTSLCLISNPIAFRAAPELPPKLRIKGRIVPLIVFDYVHETMRNGEHHVAVLRLTDPVDFECEQRFVSMYQDMIRKSRYFAVDVPQDTCFKDMYLMPLAADEEPPAVLLPFDGPGIPKRHPPMIICVMVIYGPGYSRGLRLENSHEPQVLSDRHRMPSLSASNCASFPRELSNERSDRSHSHPSNTPLQLMDIDERFEQIDDSSSRSQAAHDSLSAGVNDVRSNRSPLQCEFGPASPNDPPSSDLAIVGEADSLLPSKFFLMCREAAKEPTKVLNADEIETLPDLLLYIQLNNKPREIKEVVSRFMVGTSLSEDDRELIRKKVLEKIASEKKKKSQNRAGETAEECTARTVKESKVVDVKKSDMHDTISSNSIDLDSLNQLSTFVGASVQDLLKQVKGNDGCSGTPPSPPPPPLAVGMREDLKPEKSSDKGVNSKDQGTLPCSEMLPGPPPVPPVYGDNDSSGTDSPLEHNCRKASESPTLPRPPPFPSISVVPLPPPPSVVPDIAVPPPPPPPPKNESLCAPSAEVESMESVAQSFIAPPPPPPPVFGSSPSVFPAVAPPPPFAMFHPSAPGLIPDIPFPPQFVNGPPPPPSSLAAVAVPSSVLAGTPSVPPIGITASSPVMHPVPPPGFLNQGQGPAPYVDHKEFFPCSSSSRPGYSHGSKLHYAAQPNVAHMGIAKDRSGTASGSLTANGSSRSSGNKITSISSAPPTFGELPPLSSQLPPTQEKVKGLFPSGVKSSANHAPTDNNLAPRAPTPSSSPLYQRRSDNSHCTSKNGPRTPSPDITKKRDYDSEIERLKKDIEEEKRRAELQTRLDLLELKFQAKLRERAAQSSSSKESSSKDSISNESLSKECLSKESSSKDSLSKESSSKDCSLQWHNAATDNATTSKDLCIPKNCPIDSDLMDVDGGDSEEEPGDVESAKASGNDKEISRSEWAPTDTPSGGFRAGHGQSFDFAAGRAFLPQLGPYRGFMTSSRAVPPHPGRFGFITTPGPAVRSRGGFFPPPMRGVIRGAPNLRRGFSVSGSFAPPMIPQPFRGRGAGFYGVRRVGPRGGT